MPAVSKTRHLVQRRLLRKVCVGAEPSGRGLNNDQYSKYSCSGIHASDMRQHDLAMVQAPVSEIHFGMDHHAAFVPTCIESKCLAVGSALLPLLCLRIFWKVLLQRPGIKLHLAEFRSPIGSK